MPTSKKQSSGTSKVRNTKVNFKVGKNETAESLMRQSFEPLFSPKDNKARLTFCGVEHSIITLKKTGEQKPVIKLAFSCFDVTHEAPQVIAITCDYRVSKTNTLGQVLSMMGYQFEHDIAVIDEDDEYGTKTKQNNIREIFDFLRGQCGLVFKGKLFHPFKENKKTNEWYESSLWNIDHKTLEAKLTKAGTQERDMMASDISDDDFENPDIAMSNESD